MRNDRYISDEWDLGIKGHDKFDFVDVRVNDDNLLFIDPCLIERANNSWGQKSTRIMTSYFDKLYSAYINNDMQQKKYLLSYAGEQNGTRLGYGNGYNGKGNTANGLIEDFKPLEGLIHEIKTIGKAQDLPVFIPGFAEDGMSDLLTNILHEQLNDFTLMQMKKRGIKSNGAVTFYSWNEKTQRWQLVKKPSYLVNGKELLLVPKNIVRKNYLFGTGQYFTRIIVDRMREDGDWKNTDGKDIPKKEIIKRLQYSSEHWMYDQVIGYSKKNNDALDEYHHRLSGFYSEYGQPMGDDDLDRVIYSVDALKSV